MLVMLLYQVLVCLVTAEPLQQHCFYAGSLASQLAHIDVMAWNLASRPDGRAARQWGLGHYTVYRVLQNSNNHAANQRGFRVQAQP